MRNLTLDEKIGIKGLLQKKGFYGLAGMNMKDALLWWYPCYGKPISMWNTRKMWRKSSFYYMPSDDGYIRIDKKTNKPLQ